jgi:hypothetical protein
MLKRRNFLALSGGIVASVLTPGQSWGNDARALKEPSSFIGPQWPKSVLRNVNAEKKPPTQNFDFHPDNSIVDNIARVPLNVLDQIFPDIVITDDEIRIFKKTLARFSRLQNYIGYGNFNVIGWDQSLRFARNYQQIGKFSRAELEFIEKLFAIDANTLGFYGDKVVSRLSSSIIKKDIRKIPGTGHYLFRGDAFDTYLRIRKDIGDSVVLTSGIRSVVKQIYLFLNKAAEVDGNLSLASFSLAPPGHSYHAVGDFDVGKRNFGAKNFTEEFAQTDEFKRLSDLGYLVIRYPQNNSFGVRYEPWHIKVV